MKFTIWWIRRDVRINNNPSLNSALLSGQPVLPLFIEDPHLMEKSGQRRKKFLLDGLRQLDAGLKLNGSRLIYRHGKPSEVFHNLGSEINISGIYTEEDYTPYARRRDQELAREFPLHLVTGITLFHPEDVLKPDGKPYTVFTPFSKAWKTLPYAPANPIDNLGGLAKEGLPASLEIPDTGKVEGFPAGESESMQRLESFIAENIYHYRAGRDNVGTDGTSGLSAYFRFGMLATTLAFAAVRKAILGAPEELSRKNAETWMDELIWREFYNNILYHHPTVLKQSFHPRWRNIPWRSSSVDLRRWQAAETGFPVVDAAMRQLAQTGWMHNRARMITASFLTKDLLINWQEGEKWFLDQLVDADPAANNGGWQWSAGTGTDAAPYFRIFNPVSQGQKHDPQGAYVKKWLPELSRVPQEYIHTPWTMPLDVQQSTGCIIGRFYPPPMVDHAAARLRTLEAYKKSSE